MPPLSLAAGAADSRGGIKKPLQPLLKGFTAEREGFEPPDLLQSTVFKTAAIDRSAISPGAKVRKLRFQRTFLQKFAKSNLKSFYLPEIEQHAALRDKVLAWLTAVISG